MLVEDPADDGSDGRARSGVPPRRDGASLSGDCGTAVALRSVPGGLRIPGDAGPADPALPRVCARRRRRDREARMPRTAVAR